MANRVLSWDEVIHLKFHDKVFVEFHPKNRYLVTDLSPDESLISRPFEVAIVFGSEVMLFAEQTKLRPNMYPRDYNHLYRVWEKPERPTIDELNDNLWAE
jgi:hypothetical protein